MVVQLQLPANPLAAGAARQAVREVVRWQAPDLGGAERKRCSEALLLVSELVTNSVLHANLEPQDAIGLRVLTRNASLRVEVADAGPGFAWHDRGRPDTDHSSGRGIWLVAALADRWGIERNRGTTTVWFEIDLSSRPGRGSRLSWAFDGQRQTLESTLARWT